MTFPVTFEVLGQTVHAHGVMESLGYLVGGMLYRRARKREGPRMPIEAALWMLAGVVMGAYVGSKVLAILEMPGHYWQYRHDVRLLWQGKTIVGGMLGAWAGVEIVKWFHGIRRRTGDAFVPALMAGIAIGRIGCFLEGLPDYTYGVATTLPWGVDFGDGIHRHPTQLYESLWALTLGAVVLLTGHRWKSGMRFQAFMLGYFVFRLTVEFIKPRGDLHVGLSAIQFASLGGVVLCGWQLMKLHRREGHE